MNKLLIYITACVAIFAGSANAMSVKYSGNNVNLEIITRYNGVPANKSVDYAVCFDIAKNWHIMASTPQEIGIPTSIRQIGQQELKIKSEVWPKAQKYEYEGIEQQIYSGKECYKASAVSLGNSKVVDLTLEIKWQACSTDECIPQMSILQINLPQDNNLAETAEWRRLNHQMQKTGWFWIMLMAFAGGIILNLMPCVFPILSIKALSFIKDKKQFKNRTESAAAYTLGVVFSTLILAEVLLVLRLGGEYIGWGFQLQSKPFLAIMAAIFLLIGLMLTDIVQIKGKWLDKINQMGQTNSFLTGVLAILIASPCTAPFMGIAVAYAFLEPGGITLAIFLALGLGYALPFALITLYPEPIYKVLPKSGKWMSVLKKLFAIPVFLTCIWLLWVLFAQSIKPESNSAWQPYNANRLNSSLQNGKPVLVDFSAKWCLTCLLNEKAVLNNYKFLVTAAEHNIMLLKADWTLQDKDITQALESYGRNSVPLYVYYPQNSSKYVILPQLLTLDAVVTEIKK